MNLLFDCIKINSEKDFFITSLKVKEIPRLFVLDLDSNDSFYNNNIIDIPKLLEVRFNGSFEFLENNKTFGKLILNSDATFHLNEHKNTLNKLISSKNFEDYEIALLLIPVKEEEQKIEDNKNIVSKLLDNYHELFQIVEQNGKLSPGSAKLFTSKTIEESEDELINMTFLSSLDFEEKYKYLKDFWELILRKFKLGVDQKEIKNYKIREEYIFLTNIVIRSLSRIAVYLIKNNNDNWKNDFNEIIPEEYDFWKKDNIIWTENEVVISKDENLELFCKEDTVEKIKNVILKIDYKENLLENNVQDLAQKLKEYYLKIDKNLLFNTRSDGNMSIKSKKVFVYLDFSKNNMKLVARLHLSPSNYKLYKYNNICKKFSGKHLIGSWGENIVEINISDEKMIPTYVEIFEIAKEEVNNK